MSRCITLGVIAGLGIGASLVARLAIAQQPAPPAAPSVSAGEITLHSVSVDLPNSERTFPGGGDAEAINANCLTCHSAGMVLNQPTLTRASWQAEIEKMRGQYKAPVNQADVPAIVDYLAKYKGPR